MQVYLNGRLISHEEAGIGIGDAGFEHAVGLFETMGARNGRLFRLQEHLARLEQSARELGLAKSLDLDELKRAAEQVVRANELAEARVKLIVTAGEVSLLRQDSKAGEHRPTVLATATPPVVYAPEYFQKGVMVLIFGAAANPFDSLSGHKTLGYWGRLRTLRQAAMAGAGEAIWLSVTNHLASGAVSNIFLVKDGVVLTPLARGEEVGGGLPSPVLPGITRAAVMELARVEGLEVEKRMLSVEDLLEADEVFLTNSGWRMLPVSRVEKKVIGDGKAGPVTLRLREALLELIEKETGEETH